MPLTLALVHALLVQIGEERYALPVMHVAETTEFAPSAVAEAGGRRVVVLRDEVIPLLSLRALLRYPAAPEPGDAVAVVVLEIGEDERVGLEVDALLGQQEIVVKGFDATDDTLPVFSGATILSDGRPALILDVGSVGRVTYPPGTRAGTEQRRAIGSGRGQGQGRVPDPWRPAPSSPESRILTPES